MISLVGGDTCVVGSVCSNVSGVKWCYLLIKEEQLQASVSVRIWLICIDKNAFETINVTFTLYILLSTSFLSALLFENNQMQNTVNERTQSNF